ncbi:MAG: hypothetical protein R3288_11390 [Woeseiaceae bacterium]|nr:hypothetical protein [Woeseiaceae bacterium]
MSLRRNLPFLARNEGVWEGYYRYYDAAGNKIDEHKSRLLCRIIDDRDYHQTNLYRWADGRSDDRDFPATINGSRLEFDTAINGWAAAVDLDEHGRTMMLHWTRKADPGLYLYEMIQLSDDNQSRARVWQWFRNDRLEQRTLIDEVRVSDDWQAYEGIDPAWGDIRD